MPRFHSRVTPLLCIAALTLGLGACGTPAGPVAASPPTSTIAVHRDDELAGEVPESVRSSGRLRVATSSNLPPMTYLDTDNTTLIGFDVDMATALATTLGLDADVQTAGFDTLIPSLQSGRFDLAMSSIGVTLERQKQVDFVSYYNGGQGFLATTATGFAVTTIEQLCGLRVAVQAGSTQQSTLDKQWNACAARGRSPYEVQVFPDTNAGVLALQSGRVDVMYASISVVSYTAAQKPDTFRVAGRYRQVLVGIALAKGSELTKLIHRAVTALIKDGTYQALLDKWGVQAGAITDSSVNGATA